MISWDFMIFMHFRSPMSNGLCWRFANGMMAVKKPLLRPNRLLFHRFSWISEDLIRFHGCRFSWKQSSDRQAIFSWWCVTWFKWFIRGFHLGWLHTNRFLWTRGHDTTFRNQSQPYDDGTQKRTKVTTTTMAAMVTTMVTTTTFHYPRSSPKSPRRLPTITKKCWKTCTQFLKMSHNTAMSYPHSHRPEIDPNCLRWALPSAKQPRRTSEIMTKQKQIWGVGGWNCLLWGKAQSKQEGGVQGPALNSKQMVAKVALLMA